MAYWYLTFAVISEVIATNALKASEGFTKLVPSAIVVVGYLCSFYLLSHVLKSIPVGIAYAIWAGLGIVLVVVLAAFLFKQIPDLPAVIGVLLILSGVIVINLFSETVRH